MLTHHESLPLILVSSVPTGWLGMILSGCWTWNSDIPDIISTQNKEWISTGIAKVGTKTQTNLISRVICTSCKPELLLANMSGGLESCCQYIDLHRSTTFWFHSPYALEPLKLWRASKKPISPTSRSSIFGLIAVCIYIYIHTYIYIYILTW